MNGAIRCGSWVATPISGSKESAVWEITCDKLPELCHTVICSESEASDVVIRAQAEYRKEMAK